LLSTRCCDDDCGDAVLVEDDDCGDTMLVEYVTCVPWDVTRTISTGVPTGTFVGPVQVNVAVAEPPGGIGEEGVTVPEGEHIRVPLANSTSPSVMDVEGLSGGL